MVRANKDSFDIHCNHCLGSPFFQLRENCNTSGKGSEKKIYVRNKKPIKSKGLVLFTSVVYVDPFIW